MVSAPTKQEEELLWKESKFGSTTPEALLNTMWWLLTQDFGLRGWQEHHNMKVDDFQLCKDDNGVDFVQFTEGHTKTRQEVGTQSTPIFIHECLPLVEKDAQWLFLSSL